MCSIGNMDTRTPSGPHCFVTFIARPSSQAALAGRERVAVRVWQGPLQRYRMRRPAIAPDTALSSLSFDGSRPAASLPVLRLLALSPGWRTAISLSDSCKRVLAIASDTVLSSLSSDSSRSVVSVRVLWLVSL